MGKMKKTKVLSTALAIVLAVCMMVPFGTCTAKAATAISYDKYAATGDSITQGYGIPGFEDVDYCSPDGCYPELVGKHAGSAVENLARCGKTPGEYCAMLENTTKYSRDITALKTADLITINFGQVNVMDTVLYDYLLEGVEDILRIPDSQRSQFKDNLADVLANSSAYPSITNYVTDNITFNSAEDKEHCKTCIRAAFKTADFYSADMQDHPLKYILYINGGLYSDIRVKMIEYGATEADMDAFEALFKESDIRAAYNRAYEAYTTQIVSCINKVKSINAGKGRIVLVGYYDPAAKMKFSDEKVLSNLVTLTFAAKIIGSPFNNATNLSAEYTKKMNTYLKGLSNSHMSYVDISGIPLMSYEYAFHPSPDGHQYIATQVEAVTDTPITHSWDSGTVTKEATETEEGSIHYHCTLCDAEKDEVIPVKTSGGDSGGESGGDSGSGGGDSGGENGGDSGSGGGGVVEEPQQPEAQVDVDKDGNVSADIGKTAEVKTEGNQTTVTATVSQGTAKELIEAAKASNQTELTINAAQGVSSGNNTKSELVVPATLFADFAKADSGLDSVVIKTDAVESMTIDKTTLQTIAEAAGTSGEVKMEVTRNAVSENGREMFTYEISITAGHKKVSEFNGGTIEIAVSVPKELKNKDVDVLFIDDNNRAHTIDNKTQDKKNGTFAFEITHNSCYAVMELTEARALLDESNIAVVQETKINVKSATAKKNGKILVKWTRPSSYDMNSYVIYRSTSASGKYKPIATVKAGKLSYTDSKKLKKNKKYYYKVCGVARIGDNDCYTQPGSAKNAKCKKTRK